MKKIIILTILLLLTGCTTKVEKKLGADIIFPTTFQTFAWEKPKTDKDWAEDVKAENFDIKSTGKLEEMIEAHAKKLERIVADDEIIECPECVRYKLKKQFEKDYQDKELTDLIESEFQQTLANHNWDIEKLNQSLERMTKEIELRKKGFVMVEGESEILGGNIDPKYIRHIND